MKKVFALILAVSMLGVMAFAADVIPGSKQEFDINSDGTLDTSADGVTITSDGGNQSWTVSEYTSKTMTITSVKWTKGSDLVKSITINNDEELVIELKQNYTLDIDKGKEVVGSFSIRAKTITNKYTLGTGDMVVGYDNEIEYIDGDIGITPEEDKFYTFKKNSASYGTAFFPDALGNEIEVRVYDKEAYYLYSNTTPDLTVVKKYDSTNAELEFVNFPATPTFSSNATYMIFAEKDEFIYTIKNGALAASGAKWDSDMGCWVIKTRTLTSYVISDKKLATTATSDTTTTNDNNAYVPDTGANDVVGIATALAAVALVSAAAVSLKSR